MTDAPKTCWSKTRKQIKTKTGYCESSRKAVIIWPRWDARGDVRPKSFCECVLDQSLARGMWPVCLVLQSLSMQMPCWQHVGRVSALLDAPFIRRCTFFNTQLWVLWYGLAPNKTKHEAEKQDIVWNASEDGFVSSRDLKAMFLKCVMRWIKHDISIVYEVNTYARCLSVCTAEMVSTTTRLLFKHNYLM